MYAVIKTGGKQYKVNEGMSLKVEKLDAEAGTELKLAEVLLVSDKGEPKIGTPYVDGASVTVKVKRQAKDRKVLVYKKKRRKGYEKKVGHRQPYTELAVLKINA